MEDLSCTIPRSMGTKPPRPERRKQQRMSLAIPVRIQGYDPDGTPWEEMSVTENADFAGAAFMIRHPVALGHALHLSLPLPKPLRRHELTAASYSVYAVVRYTTPVKGGHRVGVMFLGKTAPKDYAQNPGGRFLLPSDAVPAPRAERRQSGRFEVAVRLKVTRLEAGAGPDEEQTVANNIGPGGAMVYTSLAVSKGDRVRVESEEGDLRTLAAVQNVFIGKDGIPRLNLRFLQADAAEGVRRILRRLGIAVTG
jgi:hypothetical protein